MKWFILCLLLFTAALVRLDRFFLKENDGFCLHHVFATLSHHPKWDTTTSPAVLESIDGQAFYYLTKGHQSYVFVSEDEQFVLKLYRFPSHLRAYPWLAHPLGYAFSEKRQKIKQYNLDKLDHTFSSYKLAFEQLKEETGLLMVHLNQTSHLDTTVTIQDKLGTPYRLNLDECYFVLQKKGALVFPTLDTLLHNQQRETAKQLIHSMCELIVNRCKKGIADHDAMLSKNYGYLMESAIHIDIGRFAIDDKLKTPSAWKDEVTRVTQPLAHFLKERDHELYLYYLSELNAL